MTAALHVPPADMFQPATGRARVPGALSAPPAAAQRSFAPRLVRAATVTGPSRWRRRPAWHDLVMPAPVADVQPEPEPESAARCVADGLGLAAVTRQEALEAAAVCSTLTALRCVACDSYHLLWGA
ncbi:hypothetical protein AB0M43_24020 [Longispora sp. NPDC051575]|uniref:hypothetical protein n=1 Tax=Longispora sp. NPDC051575 TaxID=3154943 RepID=UPI003435D2CD